MNQTINPRSSRWRVARLLCRWMPPILAQRLRTAIYPMRRAFGENAPFTVSSCTGSLYSGRTGDFHGYPFSIHGYYEWRNWAVALALCREGDTLIEIGANVGTETVGFRDIVGPQGKVVAIEPFPSNLSTLRRLVALNEWTNVEILALALSDRPGVVSFMPPPDNHATGVGHIVSRRDAGSIEVECASLDSLAARIGPARVIFCDTEGAEVMVLKGSQSYLRKHQPAIVLEASPKLLTRAGSSLGDLRDLLREAGYQPFAIGRFGLSQVGDPAAKNAGNWLCLPVAQTGLMQRCARMIRTCALLPCLRGVNPLCR